MTMGGRERKKGDCRPDSREAERERKRQTG